MKTSAQMISTECEEGDFTINAYGSKEWRNKEGLRHREGGPAVEYADGSKSWHLNDKLHREDGPAMEYANGDKFWYLNGQLHREGGPSAEYADGSKSWQLNNKYHREDGPAIEFANGTKRWYLNGKLVSEEEVRQLGKMKPVSVMSTDSDGIKIWKNAEGQYHREDGPAVEYPNGGKYWYLNDKLHREDGPAVECADGDKRWYLNSSKTTEEEVRKLGKMKPLTF